MLGTGVRLTRPCWSWKDRAMHHRAPLWARAFDGVFAFLMRPRVARIRRWSFVVTLPLGLFAGHSLGFQLSLGTGFLAMFAMGALELLFVVAVAIIGTRPRSRTARRAAGFPGPPRHAPRDDLGAQGALDVCLRHRAPVPQSRWREGIRLSPRIFEPGHGGGAVTRRTGGW